jgi:hypothetical protein
VIPRTGQVFTFGSSYAEAILRAFSTASVTEPHGRVRVRVNGKANRAEGLLRLRIRIPHSSPSARSNSRSHKHPCYRQKSPDTRNKRKRDATLQYSEGVFWPRRQQETHATRRSNPAGSGLDAGKGAATPSASTTPSARSDLASDGDAIRGPPL